MKGARPLKDEEENASKWGFDSTGRIWYNTPLFRMVLIIYVAGQFCEAKLAPRTSF